MLPRLQVFVTSTRPERAGLPIAEWVLERARAGGAFEAELVDLKAVGLPHLDEPRHPRLGQYEHEHTRAWSATVQRADAFVFVIPEYNHFAPPALVNAIDFLYAEWAHKAAGIVSYGGVSAGVRSALVMKGLLTAVKLSPVREGVSIASARTLIGEAGAFQPADEHVGGADRMLAELARWEAALRSLRTP